jgi:hypothetical protein
VPLFDGRSGHGFLTEIRMYMYSDRQKWYKNRRERQKNAKKTGEKRTKREREKAQTRIDLDDEILNGGGREEGKRKRHDKNKKCV